MTTQFKLLSFNYSRISGREKFFFLSSHFYPCVLAGFPFVCYQYLFFSFLSFGCANLIHAPPPPPLGPPHQLSSPFMISTLLPISTPLIQHPPSYEHPHSYKHPPSKKHPPSNKHLSFLPKFQISTMVLIKGNRVLYNSVK